MALCFWIASALSLLGVWAACMPPPQNRTRDRALASGAAEAALRLCLAHVALLAELGPATGFARLFVVFAFAKFFLHAAAFEKFFESPQSHADWLAIMYAHS